MSWVEDRFRSMPRATLEQVGGGRRVRPWLFILGFSSIPRLRLVSGGKKSSEMNRALFLYMMNSMQLLKINASVALFGFYRVVYPQNVLCS